jgi:hypothetical protein
VRQKSAIVELILQTREEIEARKNLSSVLSLLLIVGTSLYLFGISEMVTVFLACEREVDDIDLVPIELFICCKTSIVISCSRVLFICAASEQGRLRTSKWYQPPIKRRRVGIEYYSARH